MRLRRIFTAIWRVNALIILGTGILATGLLLVTIGFLIRDFTRTRQVSDVLNVTSTGNDQSTLSLGNFEAIAGIEVMRAALYLEQDYDVQSRSKEANAVQNYLFFDPATRSTHWLKPTHTGLIISTRSLPEAPYDAETPPPIAFLYTLVEQDTNQDGFLTDSDRKNIAISDIQGNRFAVVLNDIDTVKGIHVADNGRSMVLYTIDSQLKMAEIDLKTQEVISQADLQTIEPLPALPSGALP